MAGSTFEYSLDGVNWTAANPSFTNAGTYSVWVRANAANYETTRAVRATVTINPRPAVIVANSATKTAGAADPIFTGTVTGLVRAGDLGAVSFGRSNAAEGVGFYPGVIGATYLANPNYSVTVVPGNFTVLAATAPVIPAAVTPATRPRLRLLPRRLPLPPLRLRPPLLRLRRRLRPPSPSRTMPRRRPPRPLRARRWPKPRRSRTRRPPWAPSTSRTAGFTG